MVCELCSRGATPTFWQLLLLLAVWLYVFVCLFCSCCHFSKMIRCSPLPPTRCTSLGEHLLKTQQYWEGSLARYQNPGSKGGERNVLEKDKSTNYSGICVIILGQETKNIKKTVLSNRNKKQLHGTHTRSKPLVGMLCWTSAVINSKSLAKMLVPLKVVKMVKIT